MHINDNQVLVWTQRRSRNKNGYYSFYRLYFFRKNILLYRDLECHHILGGCILLRLNVVHYKFLHLVLLCKTLSHCDILSSQTHQPEHCEHSLEDRTTHHALVVDPIQRRDHGSSSPYLRSIQYSIGWTKSLINIYTKSIFYGQ